MTSKRDLLGALQSIRNNLEAIKHSPNMDPDIVIGAWAGKLIIKEFEKMCSMDKCKKEAKGYHCRSCDKRVCKDHQEPSGYGNHGGIKLPIKIGINKKWRKIK